jgi:hypothetical protein
MLKIYLCQKEKTNISGYWQDKEGKTFIDNIKIIEVKNCFLMFEYVLKAFNNGEKAVFVVENESKAYIYNDTGKIDILSKKISLPIAKNLLNDKAKNLLLHIYGGFTLFENKDNYLIETWTK